LAVLLALGLTGAASQQQAGSALGQTLEFKLDGSPQGRAGAEEVMGRLGPGARFVKSVEGQGVEPGREGPALIIPVPDALWRPSGTLAFRLRPSRTLRIRKDGQLEMVLVACPLFELVLIEHKGHVILRATLAQDGTETDKPTLQAARVGSLYWSHLKGGKWYHFAITWDAAAGRLDAYLNGSIQQEMRLSRRWHPWRPPSNPSGNLQIGGAFGEGQAKARIAVDSVQLYPAFMDGAGVNATLNGRSNFALTNEGRWDHQGSLALNLYKLTLVYETDFDKPLNWIHEDGLFEGDKRVRLPEGKDWVLEGTGGGKVWTENGRCVVLTNGKHQVLWNTRVFPENFLLEFGMSPEDSRVGLTIVFFAVRNLAGGSPFDLGVPKRDGVFRNYHSGALDCYHCSSWACTPADGGILRRTTNLRKNCGFFMPASGIDRIGGAGPGPHRVRVLKVGGKIRVETRGKLALAFDDDGKTYGPVWKDGYIGLRQMGHSQHVSYTHFKVWKVEPRVQ